MCLLQEKTCEQSTSFDLTPYELASAIAAVDRLLVEKIRTGRAGETLPEDCIVDDDSGWYFLFILTVEVSGMVQNITFGCSGK